MRTPTEAILLRVFVGEEDRYHGKPLIEAIVAKALEKRLAGATVLPGPTGFGRSRYVRTEYNVDAGARLPMVVEIIDREDKIDNFLPILSEMVESGLVTLERVRVLHYGRRGDKPRPASPPTS